MENSACVWHRLTQASATGLIPLNRSTRAKQQKIQRRNDMKQWLFLIVLLSMALTAGNSTAADHRIGGGINYWVTLEDIEFDGEKFDKNGVAYLASYQYWPGLLGLELALEFLPDRFGESAIAPEAYILLGRSIYCGLGIGIIYSDGDFAADPFFALRAGFNLELVPGLYADIYGNYRFNDSVELQGQETNIDTDTVFLGAALRMSL